MLRSLIVLVLPYGLQSCYTFDLEPAPSLAVVCFSILEKLFFSSRPLHNESINDYANFTFSLFISNNIQ